MQFPNVMQAKELKDITADDGKRRLITVSSDTPIGQALGTMRRAKVHHLVVLKEERCLGVVSRSELITAGARSDDWYGSEMPITVGDVMKLGVPSVDERTDLKSALALMLRHGVTALPLHRNGHVTDIITDTDLLSAMNGGAKK